MCSTCRCRLLTCPVCRYASSNWQDWFLIHSPQSPKVKSKLGRLKWDFVKLRSRSRSGEGQVRVRRVTTQKTKVSWNSCELDINASQACFLVILTCLLQVQLFYSPFIVLWESLFVHIDLKPNGWTNKRKYKQRLAFLELLSEPRNSLFWLHPSCVNKLSVTSLFTISNTCSQS